MQFKFRGKTYKVVEENLIDEKCVGMLFINEGLIKIDPNAKMHKSDLNYRKTILHEILHALFNKFSKLKYNKAGYGYMRVKEEEVVSFLEDALMEARYKNKDLFKWIFKL